MRITLLCTNQKSWILAYFPLICERLSAQGHQVEVVHEIDKMTVGELAFFLGCDEIVKQEFLALHRHNLVIHESALPLGKGWSPLTWAILQGQNEIGVTLFEAEEKVDGGIIYLQRSISLEGHELIQEIREKQAEATIKLIDEFVSRYPNIVGKRQEGEGSYHPRRTPKDSEMNIHQTLAEQFNLLRTVDNEQYPAFFWQGGHKYIIKIYKEESHEHQNPKL